VVGAPVGRAADVGDGKAQVDQAMIGERERGVVEGIEQRAGDQVRLLVAALTRERVQGQLVLEIALR
jgi:hypothetical protein